MESKRIRSEIEVDGVIMVPAGADVVSVDVVSYIHNDGDDHYAVGGTDEHAWQVIDDDQRVVYREVEEAGSALEGTYAHSGKLVPARLFLREAVTLQIPARKLKNGRSYTVRHLHWGHAGEGQFVAVHEPKAPAGPARKTATKKPAKKKVARKTATKKKAAKRKK